MGTLLALVAIVQSIAIGLGLGCSTLAIINFFVAIADGTINKEERKMMGVVYKVLRVAMGLILLSTLVLTLTGSYHFGQYGLTGYGLGMWTLLFVLYINAALMTWKKLSSTVGPAIQASTWYTIGIMQALLPLGWVHFTVGNFFLAYLAVLCLAIAIVNGTMEYLRQR